MSQGCLVSSAGVFYLCYDYDLRCNSFVCPFVCTNSDSWIRPKKAQLLHPTTSGSQLLQLHFSFHMFIFHQVIELLRTPNFHMLNGRIETENKYALLITCCPELHAHFLNLLWIECYYMRTVLFLIMLMKSNVNHILNLDSNMLPKRQNM